MPVGCNALNSFQLVAGCDFHNQIPPPPPVGPLPMGPHVVVYCMGFAMPSTAKKSTTVKAGWGYALGRQHDLGMGIYHFAANILLPVMWAGAGNKAEFGCSTVSVDVDGSGMRMAVALIPVVGLNLQLDCNNPCSMPTSTCVASFNTVTAGFTLADCIAGFVAMAVDVAITWLSSKIVGGIFKGIGAILGKFNWGITVMLAGGVIGSRFPRAAEFVSQTASLLLGWAVGSPLGYSAGWAPVGTLGGMANDAVNDWISPSPAPPAASPSSTAPASPPAGGSR
jgi:hypothetical protein